MCEQHTKRLAVKKSELVGKVNVPELAKELGLSETDIKLAITHTPPKNDLRSVEAITTLREAKRWFDRTTSPDRRQAILRKALRLSATLDDLDFVVRSLGFERVSSASLLDTLHSLYVRKVVREMLQKANTFSEVHQIWVKCDSDNLADEDFDSFTKMEDLIPSTDIVTVFEHLVDDVGFEVFSDTTLVHYSLVTLACVYAEPDRALAALKWMNKRGFDGEQNHLPVRLLIQKAARLFPK